MWIFREKVNFWENMNFDGKNLIYFILFFRHCIHIRAQRNTTNFVENRTVYPTLPLSWSWSLSTTFSSFSIRQLISSFIVRSESLFANESGASFSVPTRFAHSPNSHSKEAQPVLSTILSNCHPKNKSETRLIISATYEFCEKKCFGKMNYLFEFSR